MTMVKKNALRFTVIRSKIFLINSATPHPLHTPQTQYLHTPMPHIWAGTHNV